MKEILLSQINIYILQSAENSNVVDFPKTTKIASKPDTVVVIFTYRYRDIKYIHELTGFNGNVITIAL